MSTVAISESFYKTDSFTYQHLQGLFLLNLNKIGFELKLSHAEYRIMGIIIGYWNKKQGKSFPTIKLLSQYARMSNTTIQKCLKRLTELGLLVIEKDRKTGRFNYLLNEQKFFDSNSSNSQITHEVTQLPTAWSNIHDRTKRNKQIDQNIKKIVNFPSKTKIQNNNDDVSNKFTNKDSLFVENQLQQWKFANYQEAINKHGVEKLNSLIENIKEITPKNPGAYLRRLLEIQGKCTADKQNESIRINLESSGIDYCKTIEKIDDPRLSRKEILEKLLKENKIEEVKTLKQLWKIK